MSLLVNPSQGRMLPTRNRSMIQSNNDPWRSRGEQKGSGTGDEGRTGRMRQQEPAAGFRVEGLN